MFRSTHRNALMHYPSLKLGP